VNKPINIAAKLIVFALLCWAMPSFAQATADAPLTPDVNEIANTINGLRNPENISTTLLTFILLTVLTLAPAILVMTTSFTRLIVVFGFLRQAMATQ
jgi:flagellar biosynthesis protein FliP